MHEKRTVNPPGTVAASRKIITSDIDKYTLYNLFP